MKSQILIFIVYLFLSYSAILVFCSCTVSHTVFFVVVFLIAKILLLFANTNQMRFFDTIKKKGSKSHILVLQKNNLCTNILG